MAKFHDTGTICEAHKRACPLGLSDGEHIEAGSVKEFERKLAEKIGSSSSTLTSSAKTDEPEVRIFRHPQAGKIAYVKGDQVTFTKADGSPARSSATAAQLKAGRGRWEEQTSVSPLAPEKKPERTSTSEERSPETQREALDNLKNSRTTLERANKALDDFIKEKKRYDALHGVSEGRAYYYDYRQVPSNKIYGRRPFEGSDSRFSSVYYDQSPEQTEKQKRLIDERSKALAAAEAAQTRVEELGAGHKIPDEGRTIRVANQAQKWLLKDELLGQISDGKWENVPGNHWQDWSGAKVIVDPQNLGRNFAARKDNYQLNASDLLEAVGDRMEENVSTKTGKEYSQKQLRQDLKDLRGIFKTQRDNLF